MCRCSYYNPNTGTSNDYTLEVEVESNELVQINFGNGGWLDSDHMEPEKLDENGECIITSDNNYEYSIKITGRNCGNTSTINPETDLDLPRYTFEQCEKMLNLTQSEIDDCLSAAWERNDVLSENEFKSLENYIQDIRKIDAQYKQQIGQIRGKQNEMQNKINEGYIQNIERKTAYGNLSQTITIKKRGVNYLLEVRGSEKCTMGTARFNENLSDWQLVYIKQYPDIDSYSGHYMRIIDLGF